MPLFLSSLVVPDGGGKADSEWYCFRYRRYRCCCWKTRTSYRLGLGQPYLLSEDSLEDHPLSPFAFRDQVLVLPHLGGAVVLQVLGQFVLAAAAVVAVAVAAVPPELVLESPQVHPARRQT